MRKISSKKRAVSTALGAALLVCLLAPQSHAEVVSAEVSVDDSVEPDGPKEDKWKEPWRGSSFSYRNSVTALSLKKDADPGYDPQYMMSWSFNPMWWLGNVFNVSMGLSLSRELTDSNWTTQEGETILSDFSVGLGASRFVSVPVLGIDVSAKLGVVAPTSKISQARTMILALKPGFSLSKNFDVLSGINLGYSFTYTKTFHEYTTAQTEDALIDAPTGATGRSYESYFNTGRRNASWGLTNMFTAGVSFVDWLSFGANFGLVHSFVYDQEDAESDQMSEWDGLRHGREGPLRDDLRPQPHGHAEPGPEHHHRRGHRQCAAVSRLDV